jgi:hypothetical protein
MDSLKQDNGSEKKLHSLEGFLEDLNVDITEEEDIAEARREMWGELSARHFLMAAALDTHAALSYVFIRRSMLRHYEKSYTAMPLLAQAHRG